jgi:hypothetical protein
VTILVLNLNEFGLKRIGKISSMVTLSKVYSSDSSGVGGGAQLETSCFIPLDVLAFLWTALP